MNELNLNAEQRPTTPTPEENGGQGERMFTQDEVNRIVSDRLARERAKSGGDDDYKALYEAAKNELEGIKAAQLRQMKENTYRALLAEAGIYEKRVPGVMRASRAEIDAMELDENGKPQNAKKLIEGIKAAWSDFVVTTEIRGAEVPHPPYNTGGSEDALANAFKPKI